MIATASAPESESAKPRTRRGARAPARPSAPKVKSSLLLPADASQRLSIHAAMLGVDRSELVTRLINEHLREFYVVRRGGSNGETVGESAT